ncbi:DUF4129 domain-containing protein [Kribbella deserti]|uniref:DUF4129 domain-containing protein n=1 Tax=Kribbella deserti TaxID=1926257 RepID=A0ABV6QRZ1_9ACTN
MQPNGARRSSALAAAGAVGLAAAAVGLVVLVSSTGSVRPVGESTAVRTPPTTFPTPDNTPTPPVSSPGGKRPEPIDLPEWLTLGLKFILYTLAAVVVASLAYFLVRLLYRFLRQLRLPKVEPDTSEDWERVATERLADAVDQGLSGMNSGRATDAIVACWVALEQAAAGAGVPREAAETPSEFTVRVLALGNVSADSLAELAALYKEARFSAHESSEEDRQRARTALVRLGDELTAAAAPATPAAPAVPATPAGES